MLRRFVARQVSQTYCSAVLDGTGKTRLGLPDGLDVAFSNQLLLTRRCPRTESSTTSSIRGNLRLGTFLTHATRGSSVLADLRCVSGLETLNEELAQAVLKDRATARIRLYDEIMWHVQGNPAIDRTTETRPAVAPIHTSDLSHLTVCSQRNMSTFRFTRLCVWLTHRAEMPASSENETMCFARRVAARQRGCAAHPISSPDAFYWAP